MAGYGERFGTLRLCHYSRVMALLSRGVPVLSAHRQISDTRSLPSGAMPFLANILLCRINLARSKVHLSIALDLSAEIW
jgi:hypothetical protein